MARTLVEEIHFIEDSDDEVFLARLLLGSQGLKIGVVHHTALSGLLSSFDEVDEAPPMLIFVDLNMPRLRGDDVIKAIRGQKRFDQSIVGICTGSEDPADRKTSMEAGAQFFVQKPLDINCLTKISQSDPRLTLTPGAQGALEAWIDVRLT